MQLLPGTKIIYEGGYGDSLFTLRGVIVGNLEEWNMALRRFVLREDLWQAQLETGAYVTGYAEQFTLPVSDSSV